MQVNTPGGLAAVRGSYMSVQVVPGSNNNTFTVTVTCLEGNCSFSDTAGAVNFTTGQKIVSSDPNVLPAVLSMNKADVQSWLTNFPELASLNTEISTLLASSATTSSSSTAAKPVNVYQKQYRAKPHVKKHKASTPQSTPAPATNPDPDDGNNPNLPD